MPGHRLDASQGGAPVEAGEFAGAADQQAAEYVGEVEQWCKEAGVACASTTSTSSRTRARVCCSEIERMSSGGAARKISVPAQSSTLKDRVSKTASPSHNFLVALITASPMV